MPIRQTLFYTIVVGGAALTVSALAEPTTSCSSTPVKGLPTVTVVLPDNWSVGGACIALWTPYTGAEAGVGGTCTGLGTCRVDVDNGVAHPPGPTNELAGALRALNTFHIKLVPFDAHSGTYFNTPNQLTAFPTAANFISQSQCIAFASACANNAPVGPDLHLSSGWSWIVQESQEQGCYEMGPHASGEAAACEDMSRPAPRDKTLDARVKRELLEERWKRNNAELKRIADVSTREKVPVAKWNKIRTDELLDEQHAIASELRRESTVIAPSGSN